MFNYRWARRVLRGGAVVLVISDGWDRGEPELLGREMARLQRSCHRLIWLNPLLGSPGYQPLTRGMQAALPYIDDFLPAHNLHSLQELARHLNRLAARSAPPAARYARQRRPPSAPSNYADADSASSAGRGTGARRRGGGAIPAAAEPGAGAHLPASPLGTPQHTGRRERRRRLDGQRRRRHFRGENRRGRGANRRLRALYFRTAAPVPWPGRAVVPHIPALDTIRSQSCGPPPLQCWRARRTR